jgi:hypothetical protein
MVSPTLPSLTTPPPNDGGGGGARASEHDGSISRQAHELANDVLAIVGIDRRFVPPGWCGLAMWLSAGLASKWQPELVKVAAQRVAAARQRGGPPNSYRYLEQPIVREHEQAARPIKPAPTVQALNRSTTSYAPRSDTSLTAAARRALERANEVAPEIRRAAEQAAHFFGAFRKADAGDPEAFMASVTLLFAEYPKEVVDYVIHPVTGLPSQTEWPPNSNCILKRALDNRVWELREQERATVAATVTKASDDEKLAAWEQSLRAALVSTRPINREDLRRSSARLKQLCRDDDPSQPVTQRACRLANELAGYL